MVSHIKRPASPEAPRKEAKAALSPPTDAVELQTPRAKLLRARAAAGAGSEGNGGV